MKANNQDPYDLYPEVLQYAPLEFTGITVGPHAFTPENYLIQSLSFVDCTFTGVLEFSGVNLGSGISFFGCTFLASVKFTAVICNDAKDTDGIEFNKCDFKFMLSITTQQFQKNISLIRSNFDQLVRFRLLELVNASVICSENDFKDELTFAACNLKTIGLMSNKVANGVSIADVNCHNISFAGANNFDGDIYLYRCRVQNGIDFNRGLFKDDVRFEIVHTVNGGLIILDAEFRKPFEINYHDADHSDAFGISSFDISGATFAGGFNVHGRKNPGKSLPEILECNIKASSSLVGNISFSDLRIHYFKLSGYSTAKMSFRQLSIREFDMNEFVNDSALIFSGVRAMNDGLNAKGEVNSSMLSIHDTNFGKSQFFATDLESFRQILISDVILSEISTLGVTWFTVDQLEAADSYYYYREFQKCIKTKDKELISMSRASLVSWLNTRREIYRQLKFVSHKQGDMPEVHRFQAQEMRIYKQITKYQRPKNWSEYLILWASQSNKFGQNWTTALWWFIPFSLASYLPVGFLTSEKLDYNHFSLDPDDLLLNLKIVFLDNIKMWAILLNPAHRIKDLTENIDQYPSVVYLFDLLSRVVVSYFLFQIVSAFRKFSK
ncbi:hypothetical protein ACTJKN_02600 [Pedobacter sp. 22163]|uniref:hypothetical protein n=1 Tax=Pedobacter sp. 22163 TaxID=3453883 RepID=UPI003F846E29